VAAHLDAGPTGPPGICQTAQSAAVVNRGQAVLHNGDILHKVRTSFKNAPNGFSATATHYAVFC